MTLLLLLFCWNIANAQQVTPAVILTQLGNNSIPTVGSRVTYECSLKGSDENLDNYVEVLLNGTKMDNNSHLDVDFHRNSMTGHVVISDIPLEYSNTVIQCGLKLTSGRKLLSENRILLVQGLLSEVGSLELTVVNTSIVHLSWTAPFTLPISNPTITYCVDVLDVNTSLILHSQCRIHNTYYNYYLSHDEMRCKQFNFVVTPVNIVGNGSRHGIVGPAKEVPILSSDSPEVMISSSHEVTVTLRTTTPVCSGYAEFTIGHIRHSIVLEVHGKQVSFTTGVIDVQFNASFHLSNGAGSSTLYSNINTYLGHESVKSGRLSNNAVVAITLVPVIACISYLGNAIGLMVRWWISRKRKKFKVEEGDTSTVELKEVQVHDQEQGDGQVQDDNKFPNPHQTSTLSPLHILQPETKKLPSSMPASSVDRDPQVAQYEGLPEDAKIEHEHSNCIELEDAESESKTFIDLPTNDIHFGGEDTVPSGANGFNVVCGPCTGVLLGDD